LKGEGGTALRGYIAAEKKYGVHHSAEGGEEEDRKQLEFNSGRSRREAVHAIERERRKKDRFEAIGEKGTLDFWQAWEEKKRSRGSSLRNGRHFFTIRRMEKKRQGTPDSRQGGKTNTR